MIRFIYTADWHIGNYRSGPDTPGLNGRLLDIRNRIKEILTYAVNQKISRIILGGDIFRDRHPSMLHLTIFAEFLRDARNLGIKVSVIPGNHDQAKMQGQIHALSAYIPLLGDNQDIILDRPLWGHYEDQKFFFFPYLKSPQNDALVEFIKAAPQAVSTSFLILHGTVEGALAKNMTEYEIFDEDTIAFEHVMGFRGVLAGHIHECQHFNNVWYPGSIERLTFDDEGIDKFFLDVSVDTKGNPQIFKVPLQARKMMTLEAEEINQVQDGDISVEDAIVRVKNANKNYVQDIKQVLADNGVYYVTSIHTIESDLKQTPVNPGTFKIGDFVEKYAEKVKFEGDVPKVTKTIQETLAGVE